MSTGNRRVLVTGGAGFVGSHLVDRLLAGGQRVTVLSRSASRDSPNLAHHAGHEHLRVLAASAADVDVLDAELPRHDYIFHLGSAAGVHQILDQPVAAIRSIVGASDILLGACARHLTPILVMSTGEVYGKSTALPFREDADAVIGAATKPRWSYASAKALVEFLALGHHQESGLQVCVVRLFNTAGPRQRQMVLPNFVELALRGQPLTIHGDGSQRRCFCSVHDVVEALVALSSCEGAAGQIVNVGSQEEISIADLARRVVAITGSRSEVALIPYAAAYGADFDDVPRSVPDLNRIRELVGWQPTHTLDDIIRDIADHSPQRDVVSRRPIP